MAARSKAWVCGCLLAGIAVSNPAGVYECYSLVNIVCCLAEVSEICLSLVQGKPTKCLCGVKSDQVQQ